MEFCNILQIEFEQSVLTSSSVVPVSLSCSPACNVFVWALVEPIDVNDDLMNQIKINVAKGMDHCADLLRDYQWFSPCIAVIYIGNSTERLTEFVQMAGDQDWHRGRFVVQIAAGQNNEAVDDISKRWLGPLETASYTPQRIDLEKFKILLADAIETAKRPTSVDPIVFQSYTEHVRQAMDMNRPDLMASRWEQELVAELNRLLGQSFFEGTSHG